jgi:hypothetical protein
MQYTSTAFAMPIREIFRPLFKIREESVRAMDPKLPTHPLELRYVLHADDLSSELFYRPVERQALTASRLVARIQTGHLRHYLAYSFFTLLVLLWLVI